MKKTNISLELVDKIFYCYKDSKINSLFAKLDNDIVKTMNITDNTTKRQILALSILYKNGLLKNKNPIKHFTVH